MVKKTEEQNKAVIEKEPLRKEYILTVGRRKEAVARVRLYPKGTGTISVNNKPAEAYFGGEVSKNLYMTPFTTTNTVGLFDITVKVAGGGPFGQLDAVVHGIARAMVKLDSDKYRSLLKKKGLLTRDSRTRQRRMVGMGGKSRRKKQSPKR